MVLVLGGPAPGLCRQGAYVLLRKLRKLLGAKNHIIPPLPMSRESLSDLLASACIRASFIPKSVVYNIESVIYSLESIVYDHLGLLPSGSGICPRTPRSLGSKEFNRAPKDHINTRILPTMIWNQNVRS